jgi:hypothetical protein
MITFTRTAAIAPGKAAAAAAFAQKVVDFYTSNYDIRVDVLRPIGGNPNRIAWRVRYDDLAALEANQLRSQADAKYMELIGTGADLFIAGSVHDELWRSA